MFVISWFRDWLLHSLGFHSRSGNLLFLGLDYAGKTTLLELLKTGKFSASSPTGIGTKEEFQINTGKHIVKFCSIDLGGHAQLRKIWKDYFYAADAIVFVVDATDRNRIPEARAELQAILQDEILTNNEIPVVILCNKIDLHHAMGESEMIYALNIYDKINNDDKNPSSKNKLQLFMCSFLKRQGYTQAFQWIGHQLRSY